MKSLKSFIPARQGIIIGVAVGLASRSWFVGLSIILIFSFVSFFKTIKN